MTSMVSSVRFAHSPVSDEPYIPKSDSLQVLIGSKDLRKALEESLERHSPTPPFFSLKPDDELIDAGGVWSRDNRVILHDESHLIPRSPKEELGRSLLNYCLASPHSDKYFLKDVFVFSGDGCNPKNRAAAIAYASRSNKAFIQSNCCLEGGNLILFSDARGEKKALIGTHSIAMSYLTLTDEGAFDCPEFEGHSKAVNPLPLSDFILIKSRNIRLCEQESMSTRHFSIEEFIASTLAPISIAERSDEELLSFTKKIRAKWTYTQSVIAKELRIPLENIGWIEQEDFHIDMAHTVIENCVFVYDGKKAVEIIDVQLSRDFSERRPSLLEYRKEAAFLAPYYARINERNKGEFEKLGLKMVPIAGRFEALTPSLSALRTLNFFNGILLPTSKREERIYAVAPCPYPRFYEHFFKVVRNSISEGIVLRPLPVHFIIQGEGTALKIADIVGNYLTIGEGGIRCATNMAPQKSIFSERLLPSPTSTLTLFSPSPLEPEE